MLDALGQHVQVRIRRVVAGDAERHVAVIAEDRDAGADPARDGNVGDDLLKPASHPVERLTRARHVGGDRDDFPLRQPEHLSDQPGRQRVRRCTGLGRRAPGRSSPRGSPSANPVPPGRRRVVPPGRRCGREDLSPSRKPGSRSRSHPPEPGRKPGQATEPRAARAASPRSSRSARKPLLIAASTTSFTVPPNSRLIVLTSSRDTRVQAYRRCWPMFPLSEDCTAGQQRRREPRDGPCPADCLPDGAAGVGHGGAHRAGLPQGQLHHVRGGLGGERDRRGRRGRRCVLGRLHRPRTEAPGSRGTSQWRRPRRSCSGAPWRSVPSDPWRDLPPPSTPRADDRGRAGATSRAAIKSASCRYSPGSGRAVRRM